MRQRHSYFCILLGQYLISWRTKHKCWVVSSDTTSMLHLPCFGYGKRWTLGMVRSKELVQYLKFGVVDCEMSVVIVMILAIKEVAKHTGCCKPRVPRSTIPTVAAKVEQMNPKVGWKEKDRYAERRELHNHVFDKTILPSCAGNDLFRSAMVATMPPVERRNMKQVVNAKCPNFPPNITR